MCKPEQLGGLGFRDIELFNLSLLARHGWRMLQNPGSLSARVLKSVYFPETDVLQATVGSAPSQVWRAVHEGIQVLKQGLIRRIGTGENTHPWNDQWLPREGMLRPIACIADEPPSRVADFIAAESATWNEEKLRQYMLPMDVETVLQIPLSHHRQHDLWAWHYDRKGIFSVRSAYRMLIYTREKREAWLQGTSSGSSNQQVEKQWTALWRTRVPSKIRVFLWRLAKQSLPTNDVRHHRHMCEEDRCQLCGAVDSWRHALLDCTMSRCVWALVDPEVTEHVCSTDGGNARLWLANLIETLSLDAQTKVFVTLWAIWHARRKAIHEQQY
jgi:hypothetical protein